MHTQEKWRAQPQSICLHIRIPVTHSAPPALAMFDRTCHHLGGWQPQRWLAWQQQLPHGLLETTSQPGVGIHECIHPSVMP